MEIKTKNNKISTRLLMLALAIYPVLYSYVTSFNIKYCDLFFILVIIVVWCLRGFKNIFKFPRFYLTFWIYAAMSLIMVSHGFKVTYLIPGGIAFVIFSLNWGASAKYFNLTLFYRIIKFVYILSVIVFLAQLFNLLPPQYHTSAILPISDHVAYSDVDYTSLMNMRLDSDRPCSFFLEPAYYAQFLLIYLALELFYHKHKNIAFSLPSLFCIIIILLVKSGLGLVGLIILFAIKILTFFNQTRKKGIVIIVLVPLVIAAIYLYFSTETGLEMLERQGELTKEGTSGFLRVVQGFMIFDALPTLNKILGVSMEDVVNMHLPFITYNESGEANLFTNGLCSLLLRMGLVGTVLLFIVYFFIWKEGTILSRVLIVLLFVMSIIEQVYLSSSMLIISVIASCDLKTSAKNENSIPLTKRTL